MARFTIRPNPPFDFSLSAAIFTRGDPGFRIFQDGRFRHAIEISGVPVVVDVTSTGTVDRPELEISLGTRSRVPASLKTEAKRIVERIFNTSDDILPFYQAMQGDPVMAGLVHRLKGLRAPSTLTFFEAIIDSVIEQQISLAVAQGLEYRMIHRLGSKVDHDGSTLSCYPRAAILAETPVETFRQMGMTVRKGEYIRGISGMVRSGDLDPEQFRDEPDTETIIKELVKIRGIGRWTAELAILRGLHRPEVFPADDVGVRRFIAQYYLNGEKINAEKARVFAERWGEWKGFAAFYLEVADLLAIIPEQLPTSA